MEGRLIARSVEEEISRAWRQVKRQAVESPTYQSGLQLIDSLSRIQQDLRELRDRYCKQYEIDPRDYVRSVAFSNDGRLLALGFLHGALRVLGPAPARSSTHTWRIRPASPRSPSARTICGWLRAAATTRLNCGERTPGRSFEFCMAIKEVSAVAFSPDGHWLVSSSHDRQIKIWRVVTGRESQTLEGHTGPVTAAIFTPDGQTIVSASWDKTIRLWSVATGLTTRILTGHTKGVGSLAVSLNGRWLASGGEDATVRLWDLKTGLEARSFGGHRNSVTSVAFSPDGELLAAGCLGRVVIVWKRATGAVVKRLGYENISYNSVAFSPRESGWPWAAATCNYG